MRFIYRLKIIIEMVIKLIIWMWNLINTEVIKKELVCNYISSFFIMKVSKLKSIDTKKLNVVKSRYRKVL